MGRHHLIVALVLLLATAAHGQHLPGEAVVQAITQNGVNVCGGTGNLELPPADFSCYCGPQGSVCSTTKPLGTCIGEPADWCGTVDLSAAAVTLPSTSLGALTGTSLTSTGAVTAGSTVSAGTSVTTPQLYVNPTGGTQVQIQPNGTMSGTYFMLEFNPNGATVASGASIGAMRMPGTITLNANPSGFGWFYFMQLAGTVQNASGTAVTASSGVPLSFTTTFNANNANLTLNDLGNFPAVGEIYFGPTLSKTGSAALAAQTVYPVVWSPSVNTGATATNLGVVHAFDIQGSATTAATNLAMIDIDDITNSKVTNGPIIFRNKGVDDQNRLAGMTMIGADAASSAHLQVREATINNEVVRWESGAAGTPLPSQRIYFARATAAASSTTNIDFNLTTARPTEAACPSGTLCVVDSLVICHCTSGSACTGDGGALLESKWAFKNAAGTVSQLGTTASGFILGQSVASLTSTYVSSGSAFVTSITQTLTSNSIREAVVVPTNSNLTCHVIHTVNPVGT
jgi:hypothetical protein